MVWYGKERPLQIGKEGKRFYSFWHSFDQTRIDQDGAEVIKDITDHPRNSPK